MAIDPNVETVLFDNHSRITEISCYEQPGTSSLVGEINDPMTLVNFSLPSPGEDGTYGDMFPIFSIDPVAAGVPAQEVISPLGNERRQVESSQPPDGSLVAAATPSPGSHSPIIPLSSWVGAQSSLLSGWRGSQWMGPSAKVSSIIVQGKYEANLMIYTNSLAVMQN